MSNPISGAAQIAFCNNTIRPGSNMLGQAYTSGRARNSRWVGLGSGAAALAQMLVEITKTADFFLQLYDQVFRDEKEWQLKGQGAFIPQDAGALIFDVQGAQDPSRPGMNAANVFNLVSEEIAFRQWLQNGAFATGGTAGNYASYNTVMQVSSKGPTPIVLGDATNFITRCAELIARYEANNNAVLNVVLACATNPGLDANR